MNNLISKDYIVTGPLQNVDVPKCDIWTFLEKSFEKHKDKVALLDPVEGKSLTFAEVKSLSHTIAVNLQKHGYNPEKALAIYMANCCEYVLFCLAVWRLGGSVAVINPLLTVNEINSYLKVLKSEYLMCNSATVEKAIASTTGTYVKTVICKEEHQECLAYSELCHPSNTLNISNNCLINPEKCIAAVAFSSGTTGVPKAVQLSHSALIQQVVYATVTTGLDRYKNGITVYQPMSHIYGLTLFMMLLHTGQKNIPMPKFELETYLQYIEKFQLEILAMVPPIAVLFTKSPLVKNYDLISVEVIGSGAAPLGKDTEIALKEVFNNKPKVVQGYGMTECCSAVLNVPINISEFPQGSVGWALPATCLKVVDVETGRNLGPDQNGEICVKCNYLMSGYLDNPKATAETIRDGWLHTGDIGYFTKEGCFFIVDRLKELLKYKGYQVSPSELEALLLTHPEIADAAVTSIPDEAAGDLPCAWIVLKSGVKLEEKEVQDFVEGQVAPFKKLRGGVKFVDVIPKSPSGKIMRRIMKQEMQKT